MPTIEFDLSVMSIKNISIATKLTIEECNIIASNFQLYNFHTYQGGNPDYRIVEVNSLQQKDEDKISKILIDSFLGNIVTTEY